MRTSIDTYLCLKMAVIFVYAMSVAKACRSTPKETTTTKTTTNMDIFITDTKATTEKQFSENSSSYMEKETIAVTATTKTNTVITIIETTSAKTTNKKNISYSNSEITIKTPVSKNKIDILSLIHI